MQRTRILVIDDEVNVCRTLQVILGDEGYKVDTTQDGVSALSLFQEKPYDVVISDIRMAALDGMAVLRKIKQLNSETIVFLITGYGTMDTAIDAFRTGADDFIPKPLDMDYLKTRLKERLTLLQEGDEIQLAKKQFGLTAREAEVVQHVRDGHRNAEIARQLGISEGTVKVHLEHVYGKAGVHSRTALLARLRELTGGE